MKIKVTIEVEVDTEKYEDVKTPREAAKLIYACIDGEADWPYAQIKAGNLSLNKNGI